MMHCFLLMQGCQNKSLSCSFVLAFIPGKSEGKWIFLPRVNLGVAFDQSLSKRRFPRVKGFCLDPSIGGVCHHVPKFQIGGIHCSAPDVFGTAI